MTMVGKWLVINNEDHYHIGEVVLVVCLTNFLVRIKEPDNNGCPATTMRLVTLEDVDFSSGSVIFNNEAELNAWLAWLDKPEEDGRPRVVPIKKGPYR